LTPVSGGTGIHESGKNIMSAIRGVTRKRPGHHD
jgi:hypothetical protein